MPSCACRPCFHWPRGHRLLRTKRLQPARAGTQSHFFRLIKQIAPLQYWASAWQGHDGANGVCTAFFGAFAARSYAGVFRRPFICLAWIHKPHNAIEAVCTSVCSVSVRLCYARLSVRCFVYVSSLLTGSYACFAVNACVSGCACIRMYTHIHTPSCT